MRKLSVRSVVINLTCALFVLLFTYAALSKILDFQKFQIELGKSPLINSFSIWVAYGIPVSELVLVFLLFVQRTQLLALYCSFSLMIMFTAYIIAILQYSDYIPCSCGGVLQNMTWTEHVWFNVFFIVISAASVLLYPNRIKSLSAIRGNAWTLKWGHIIKPFLWNCNVLWCHVLCWWRLFLYCHSTPILFPGNFQLLFIRLL